MHCRQPELGLSQGDAHHAQDCMPENGMYTYKTGPLKSVGSPWPTSPWWEVLIQLGDRHSWYPGCGAHSTSFA